jgi:hypothetical protein
MDGRFEFGTLPEVEYKLLVFAPGYRTSSFVVGGIGVSGQNPVLALSWSETGNSVEGRVLTQQGDPVSGATVSIQAEIAAASRNRWKEAQIAGEDGYYRFEGLPDGNSWVTAIKSGYGPALAKVEFSLGREQVADLVLKTKEEIDPLTLWQLDVQILDEHGIPLTGAELHLYDGLSGTDRFEYADQSGMARFEDLTRNSHTLTVEAQGYLTETLLVGPEARESLQITLSPEEPVTTGEAGLTVIVSDPDGNLLPGIAGFLYVDGHPDFPFAQAATDTDGRIEFLGLSPQSYRLQLYNSEFLPVESVFSLASDEHRTISVILEPVPSSPGPGEIIGFVTSAGGGPVEGARVMAYNSSTGGFSEEISQVDGSYSLNVDSGQILLTVKDAAHFPYKHAKLIALEVEGSIRVDVQLVPLSQEGNASVSGLIRNTGGQPLSDVSVLVRHQAEDASWQTQTGADGRYEVEDLIPGPYRIFIGHQGYEPVDMAFDLASGQTLTLDFDLLPAGLADLQGFVFGPEGEMIEDALIRIPLFGRETFSMEDGRYFLDSLPVEPGLEIQIECSFNGFADVRKLIIEQPVLYDLDFHLHQL